MTVHTNRTATCTTRGTGIRRRIQNLTPVIVIVLVVMLVSSHYTEYVDPLVQVASALMGGVPLVLHIRRRSTIS